MRHTRQLECKLENNKGCHQQSIESTCIWSQQPPAKFNRLEDKEATSSDDEEFISVKPKKSSNKNNNNKSNTNNNNNGGKG
jgi:hypothetical protein